MMLINTAKYIDKKSYFLGTMALLFSTLCTIAFWNFGTSRPWLQHFAIPGSLIGPLVLTASLWACCFKTVRIKYQCLLAFFLFFSGIGVGLIAPSGAGLKLGSGTHREIICYSIFIFYLWIIYGLFKEKQVFDKKSWPLAIMALVFTLTSTKFLYSMGQAGPPRATVLSSLISALILNGSLWLCCLKPIRVKLKYLMAFCLFPSGFGVAIANPLGLSLPVWALAFHWWLIYDLIKTGETL